MPSLCNSTVLGFREPFVKGGDVVLPALIHGELTGISASPSVWRSIVTALVPFIKRQTDGRSGPVLSPTRGHPADADRRAAYHAAWLRYEASEELTVKDCAKEFGITEAAMGFWFRRYRAVAAASSGPILKPSGGIL